VLEKDILSKVFGYVNEKSEVTSELSKMGLLLLMSKGEY
jgi:hypothetical protein